MAINAVFGDNGLINRTNIAKIEAEKADAREQLELVLADAYMEKNLNKEEYNENEYLDKYVQGKNAEIYIEEYEIGLNGYIFELDRSVPRLGKYKGQESEPRIKEIKITGKTTKSVTVEVDARNAEGAEYTYSYQKVGEDKWQEIETSKNNTCTIDNLESNESYTIKVKVETEKGTDEDQISTTIGELPEGTITFGEVEWAGDGTASVAINTSEEGYQLQYQKNSIEGQWTTIESGEKITGLEHNDTVYGRLFDGTNGTKDDASVSIQDKVDPIITVNPGGTTTNSITVSVVAKDNESGMAESLTYTYYIKKTSEDDGSYATKATGITQNSYIFTELQQETSYDIKVEVTGDKAGRTGTGVLANQETTKVGGAGDLATGAIVASSPIWSSGEASITLTTDTGMQIQYQINGIGEGQWTTVTTGAKVSGLHHNDTVYARLYDGINAGDYGSVSIQDGVDPVVTVTKETITTNSIQVSVSAKDNESGMADNLTYTYYIKKSSEQDTSYVAKATGITQNSYTFSGLQQETSYDVKVEVNGDKAGRTGTGTLTKQTTTKVGGAEGGLTTGAIVASAPTWSSGEASITLTTTTGMQIQYQVNKIDEESWTTASTEAQVSGLHHNDTVYARLYDGTNYGDYASVDIKDTINPNVPTINLTGTAGNNGWYKSNVTVQITAGSDNESGANKIRYSVSGAQTVGEVTTTEETTTASITITAEGTNTITAYTIDKAGNISDIKKQIVNKDMIAPTVNISVGNKTEKSIEAIVEASDGTSGLATKGTYKYFLNSESAPRATCETKSYTYDGLTPAMEYTIKVIVTDEAGNEKEETIKSSTEKLKSDIEKAKESGENFSTTVSKKDDLGNTVWIPGGFKVAGDSGIKVEEGIVIEDSTNGNQFVWVPVGEYKVSTTINSTGKLTNNLSRRTFTSEKATEVEGDKGITTNNGFYYYAGEGNANSVAKNTIGAFKTSAIAKGGFYIGRFEQGVGNVIKKNVEVYDKVLRETAISKAKAIYSGDYFVGSALISSYAWDTTLNFICQTNTPGYELATTTSSKYGNIGTGSYELKNTGMYEADKYSNIHDILGNVREWTTEYCSSGGAPCVHRGGYFYDLEYYAARRLYQSTSYGIGNFVGFRTQIYVK